LGKFWRRGFCKTLGRQRRKNCRNSKDVLEVFNQNKKAFEFIKK
jgi:hypothetical protein